MQPEHENKPVSSGINLIDCLKLWFSYNKASIFPKMHAVGVMSDSEPKVGPHFPLLEISLDCIRCSADGRTDVRCTRSLDSDVTHQIHCNSEI